MSDKPAAQHKHQTIFLFGSRVWAMLVTAVEARTMPVNHFPYFSKYFN